MLEKGLTFIRASSQPQTTLTYSARAPTLHPSVLSYITSPQNLTMPVSPCHVGVAFYNVPGFSPQWVLVLSERRLFEGAVWCNSLIETVNGWHQSSRKCTPSLAALDPMRLLSGVIHVAYTSLPMKKLRKAVSRYKISSDAGHLFVPGADMHERYVTQVLLHLCRGRCLRLPTLSPVALADMIRGRASILPVAQCPTMDNMFPVVRLTKQEISFGRFLL